MSSITIVRRIAARPSIVFEALVTVEGVAAWWGPDALPIVSAEVDARVGGSYRIRFRNLDGSEHETSGEYLEIVPPRRIVMSYRYTFGGEPEEDGRTSRVQIDVAPLADGTELTLTHGELRNDVSKKSHEWGWGGALDKLVKNHERAEARATITANGGDQ